MHWARILAFVTGMVDQDVAAAPLNKLTNSRRLMLGIGLPPRCRRRSYQLEPPGAGGLTPQGAYPRRSAGAWGGSDLF
jgi:hypothetical protein